MNHPSDLFDDPEDLVGVLEAHGKSVPDDLKSRRQCVRELFDQTSEAEIITVFAQHATKFMQMVREIDAFCQSVGTTVGGRIQLQADGQPLQFDGLSSGWVFDGPSDWESAEHRALAFAEELRYLTAEFDPNCATDSRWRLTDFGQSLRGTIFESLDLGGTHSRETAVSVADLEQIKAMRTEMENTLLSLRNGDVPPAVLSALDIAISNLSATHAVLDQYAHEYGGQPNGSLAALGDAIRVLLLQLARLIADVNVGQRASRERSDFLRTELWKQRWRIYEIWLLVRVLSALRDAGATVCLNAVQDGVWNLHYAQSLAPAATCSIGQTQVNVYYQLHVQSETGADMPDIAIIGARPIVILDPKHGKSYTRSKVQSVLMRYAARFSAVLTAIVNYYPIRSYGFETVADRERRWLLASGISPDSAGIQRLDLLVRDAMLATGHVAVAHEKSKRNIQQHRASTQAFLVYFASFAVEVDEPQGFWSVRAGRGPEWLAEFEAIIGPSDKLDIASVAIKADQSADDWLIGFYRSFSKDSLVVWRIHEGESPAIVNSKVFDAEKRNDRRSETSPSGRYRIEHGPRSKREGVELLTVMDHKSDSSLPLIRYYGDYAKDFLWAPDESAVAFRVQQQNETRLMMAHLGERHAMPVSLPGQSPSDFAWMTPKLLRSVTEFNLHNRMATS